jgi:hypothetical protein
VHQFIHRFAYFLSLSILLNEANKCSHASRDMGLTII